MTSVTIMTSLKKPKFMHVKFFPEIYLLSKNWQSRSSKPTFRFPFVIRPLLLFLITSFVIGCSQKRGIAKNSDQQYNQDVTQRYLPVSKVSLQGVVFARVDKNPGLDLIGFVSIPSKGSKIKILFNKGKNGIGRGKESNRVQQRLADKPTSSPTARESIPTPLLSTASRYRATLTTVTVPG